MKHLPLTLQLLDWHESKRGQKVLFEIMQDVEHPHAVNPFKDFTTRNGKHAGQLFAAVLVLLDPETGEPASAQASASAPAQAPAQAPPASPPAEQSPTVPAPAPAQPGPAELALGLGDTVQELSPSNMAGLLCRDPKFQAFMEVKDEAECAAKLKELLRIKSRAELDAGHLTLAVVKFNELREKFRRHLTLRMTAPLPPVTETAKGQPSVPF